MTHASTSSSSNDSLNTASADIWKALSPGLLILNNTIFVVCLSPQRLYGMPNTTKIVWFFKFWIIQSLWCAHHHKDCLLYLWCFSIIFLGFKTDYLETWIYFRSCFFFFFHDFNKRCNNYQQDEVSCVSVTSKVSSLWDLMPYDLRWSCCNNHKNKCICFILHNKCNVLESSWNHLPPNHPWEKCLPETSAWSQKGWGPLSIGSDGCLS